MNDPLQFVGTVLLLTAAVPGIIFAPLYHRYSNGLWKRSRTGRALMLLGICMQAIFAFSITSSLLGYSFAGREYLRILLYGFLAVAMFKILGLLVGVNRDPERYRPEYEETDK